MRERIRTLLNSAVLLVLPQVETALVFVAHILTVLEAREAALERRIEDKVVNIGKASQQRRQALDEVHRYFDKVNAKNLARINADRTEIQRALDARSSVQTLIGRG